MVILRLFAIALTLLIFLLVAVPLQWIVLRLRSPARGEIAAVCSRLLLFLLRVRVCVQGSPAAQTPRLIAANHISWIDILALMSVEPVCFLAKREVGGWPLVAAFARLQETVFVDRKRRRTIPAANAAMAQRMLDGRCVLLFPEGTTGDGLDLRKFHSSHLAAARDLLARATAVESVAIQPVGLSYSSPLAAWTGDAALLPHIWAVLRGAPLRCELIFGEPLLYARGADRKAVAKDVAARIAVMRAAGAPMLAHEAETAAALALKA